MAISSRTLGGDPDGPFDAADTRRELQPAWDEAGELDVMGVGQDGGPVRQVFEDGGLSGGVEGHFRCESWQ